MKAVIHAGLLLLLLLVVTGLLRDGVHAEGTSQASAASVPGEQGTQNEPAGEENPDWDLIRKSAEVYVAAYNSADAEAIGQLYMETAVLVDAAGTLYRGRADITDEYAAFFKEHPDAILEMSVENLTFVSPTVAIEEGTTESRLGEDQPPSLSRYLAVHVKEGDRWRLASVRDQEVPAGGHANLEALNWMIGRWVDEDPDSLLQIDCYWDPSGAYLMRDVQIKIEGLLAPSATERIGWDPLNRQIRSWLFDSQGGHLEGIWVNQDDQWTVTAHGFRADGEPIHVTYVVSPLRDDAYHVHSLHRTAGSEELEDFEMTVVRRPPAPGQASADENAPAEENQE